MTKTALITLALTLLPWSAVAKPAHVSLHGADKQIVTPSKSHGLDITAASLRVVMHPSTLTGSTDPKAVTAGHDPMEIQLLTSPKRELETKLGKVRSVGAAFSTKVSIDGTKGGVVLAGKLPKGFELKKGQRLVTIAVFEVPKTKSAPKPSVAVFPSIVGFDNPIISVKGPLPKFDVPLVGFDNPIISFDNPLIALDPGLFDFDNPIISFDNPIISLGSSGTKVGKLPSKAPTTMVKGDLDPMALGFMGSKSVYVGPAKLTAEGPLGLVAATGTLTEIGFGVME